MPAIEGYREYQRREYCKAIECPVQQDLDALAEHTPAYETTRDICVNSCRHTTYEFHHWLMKKGYVIVKPEG